MSTDRLVSDWFEVELVGTHGLIIPELHVEPFLERGLKRVEAEASYADKSLSFHGALHHYKGQVRMSFGRRYQKQLGLQGRGPFKLRLLEDQSRYGVEMPEEFSAVLEMDREAYECFESLTSGLKRSLIYYILRVKNSQLRIDRALIICDNLRAGIRDGRELVKDRR
jgi:hypothetical protein